MFRCKFLSGLEMLHTTLRYEDRLEKLRDKRRFKKLLQMLAKKTGLFLLSSCLLVWSQVIHHLGSYTCRLAISNYRVIKVENDHVYFSCRDSRQGNKRKVISLHVREFMKCFLLYILPHCFVRIRHYGFLGNRFRKVKIVRLKAVLILSESTP